jgi:hypothetical protein
MAMPSRIEKLFTLKLCVVVMLCGRHLDDDVGGRVWWLADE